MELVRWEPFAGFGSLRSVFNDLFDGDDRSWVQSNKSYPAMDVLESKDSYLVRAELPGMIEYIRSRLPPGSQLRSRRQRYTRAIPIRRAGRRLCPCTFAE